MFDFGSSNDHSNNVAFGQVNAYGTSYSLAMWYKFASTSGSWAILFSSYNSSTKKGIEIRRYIDGGQWQIIHGYGSTSDSRIWITNTAWDTTSWHSVVISHNKGNGYDYWFADGASLGALSIIPDPVDSGENWAVGNRPSVSSGAGAKIGRVAIWPDTALSAADAKVWHEGYKIPRADKLGFFAPCLYQSGSSYGYDQINQVYGTKTGTVTMASSPIPRMYGASSSKVRFSIIQLLKVLTATEGLSDSGSGVLGLIKLDSDTVGLVDQGLNIIGLLKLGSDTLGLLDGDNNDLYDPAGKLTETMSDGTVWTKLFPPFTRRTKWTTDA